YRGAHGNLRLWRECKPPQLFGVRGAVLVEAGSSRLYRREYVHPFHCKLKTTNFKLKKALSLCDSAFTHIVKKVKLWYDVERNMVF
ncbi:MAG: hypothetical protein LKJ09_06065, partial [Enterococcaceae bacterium]|nr:hypothetical protein [Sporolactobacillus sp.]MCI1905869.1 hypothetical protein [Enterococcaceae bacterium]